MQPIDATAIAEAAEVALCSLPNGVSAFLVPALAEAGLRVIDLAGDFRLPAPAYPQWYGFEHPDPPWIDKAAYGLPELFAARMPGAQLVANPGCVPTAVILGCAPLLSAGLIEPSRILVDGKTGVSGAGHAPSEASMFSEAQDSVRPYRATHHQHTPEIEHGLELATGARPPILFVPHVVPMVRGLLTTSFATLMPGATSAALADALVDAYTGSPFVRVLRAGSMTDPKRVRGTNVVEFQVVADPRSGTAIVLGALHNLVKGAAGQAVQNLNLMLGFDQATGPSATGEYP